MRHNPETGIGRGLLDAPRSETTRLDRIAPRNLVRVLALLLPLASGAGDASAQDPAVFRAWWLGAMREGTLFEGDQVTRSIRLGLWRVPPIVPFAAGLPGVEPLYFAQFTSPGRAARPRPSTAEEWMARAAAERLSMASRDVVVPGAFPRDTTRFPPGLPAQDTAMAGQDILPDALARYADLGMRVTGNGELGGQWLRFRPCDPSVQFNCNPGLFPQLRPDVQFAVTVAGTISDRVHVDVDYDQTREETLNSNDIRVYYEGLAGEVVRRVEVGDVSFAMPRSRYLTQGVPAGNFGFMASGQAGPMEFQTVWAQQRGDLGTREFRLAGGATQGLVQDDRIVLDDADYTKGQFFFLVHPGSLRGAPHVDALALVAADAPATLRPERGGTIQLYRDERIPPASGQQQIDLFLADALSADRTLRHSGQFRRLEPEQDYIVHSSGLWIMLRSPLRAEEALAVSYVTESRDTIGTVNAEQARPGTTPVLRLLRSPVASHQPGRPTWDFEMHQVYRVNSTSGVDVTSIDVVISLGDRSGGITFRASAGRQVSFLRLFGLDEDAPVDRLDIAQVFQPDALSGFGGTASGSRITGTYIVFPTLEPFASPPPVPSAGLDAAAAQALLGNDANRTIYRSTDPVLRDGGGRFRINLAYRVRVEGLTSSFNLGQFGIREGSERITVGDRVLVRDTDYSIDYEIGQVTLSDPAGIFATNPNAEIRATWEQKALFQIAPTSMFGANARWQLGGRGELNVVGLVQSQKTLYSRPQLGTEPAAIFLGGVSADVDLGAAWLDRAFVNLPFVRSTGPSRVTLSGEMAVSLPDPNRRDQAYYEDFEGGDEVGLDVRRQQWKLGSRPDIAGDDGVLPAAPDARNAARLVWQHDIATGGVITGSLLPARDIDRQINVIGNQLPESVMWLTFGERTNAPGERLWRSITTVLSTTGRDMTRSEFLELYVNAAGPEPLALVFDFGTVAEDAFYVDAQGRTNGVYGDGRPWGLGRLDEEARVAEREVWGLDKDARGLWDQPCLAEGIQAYGLGDERSNCTKGNGLPDTEDLDGNGLLDQSDGAYFRYVIRLDGSSRYMVRDTSATGTGFRLYRIPLREGVPVNGASDGTWRFIKHVRMTVAGAPGGVRKNLSIARMRIIGSRWTKRDVHGINRGLISDEPGLGAASTELRVGPVSRVTDGAAYAPPPGVTDQLQDPTAQFGAQGVEVNERAQRIAYTALEPGDRAEIYFRYPQQPRSFLTYRQLRLWALAKRGQWGPTGQERLVVKVGTDDRNFYLFQTRLPPAIGTGAATANDWLPEIVIDFDRWFALRVEAEERQIRGGGRIGVLQDTVWSADSTYAIVLEDRARAPNLNAVREVSLAVYNGGPVPLDGEVWINDIRLDGAFRDPGAAGNVRLDITGSDVFSASIAYANQGAVFRQLNQGASYVGSGDISLNGRAQLDRMLPEPWGIDAPLNITHTRSGRDPSFLEGSDVQANALPGLRDTGAGLTSIGVRIAKRTPMTNPWLGLLVDGIGLTLGYDAAHTNTITSRAETSALRAGVDWQKDVGRIDVDAIPGFVEDALRALAPATLEQSDVFARLLGARLRLTPERLGFGTNWASSDNTAFRYRTILAGPADTLIAPIESPRRSLENNMNVDFRPFDPLSAGITLRSSRDLLDPDLAAVDPLQRQALASARGGIAGADLGWEVNRSTMTNVTFRPVVASWFRPVWTWNNRYGTDRNPSYISLDVFGEDTTALLQRRFGSDRQVQRRLDVQPTGFVRAAFGQDPDSLRGVGGLLARAIRRIENVSILWNSTLGSQFEREDIAPGLGYQLGLGDLESFRAIGTDTAATANDRDDVRINSLIALSRNAQLTIGYTHTGNEGFDARGGRRTQQQTGWPNIRLAWRQIPLPAAIGGVVRNMNAGIGYERLERESVLGLRTPQLRAADEKRYVPELSLAFAAGITASYNATISRARTTDPTGNGEQDGDSHRIQVTGSFQPPAFMREKIQNPITTIVSFTDDTQRRCRFRPSAEATETCVDFVDTTNRTFALTLDTALRDITVGLRINYTSRDNRVGTRTGSSQFQLALFGGFVFQSGEVGR